MTRDDVQPQDPANLRALADWLEEVGPAGLDHHAPEDLRRIADALETDPPRAFPDWRIA